VHSDNHLGRVFHTFLGPLAYTLRVKKYTAKYAPARIVEAPPPCYNMGAYQVENGRIG
jgi:hypothetical protein